MHLVQLHTIHHWMSTAATPSHKFHHISWCLSDVTKVNLDVVLTEKYKGSSEKTVRVPISQWKYAKCFIWNFINLSFPLSLFLSDPPISLHPPPQTHTETDKSFCEPGQFPALMTSCLQTRRTVSQGSWSLTPSHCLFKSCILSLYSNDLWPYEAEYSEWIEQLCVMQRRHTPELAAPPLLLL